MQNVNKNQKSLFIVIFILQLNFTFVLVKPTTTNHEAKAIKFLHIFAWNNSKY